MYTCISIILVIYWASGSEPYLVVSMADFSVYIFVTGTVFGPCINCCTSYGASGAACALRTNVKPAHKGKRFSTDCSFRGFPLHRLAMPLEAIQ